MIMLAATPIGNLGDASARLREALGTAEVIAAEDTRTAAHLLRALGIEHRPRLVALHEHNETAKAAELVELARDQDVLVLTDAGMPGISDPGYGLVAAAVAAGVRVTAILGPERRAHRPRGERAAHRSLHVRGLPAAQGPAAGAEGPRPRAAHDGVLRVAEPARRRARRPRRRIRRRPPRSSCAAS